MNIVFCTSECRPYASTGGLADVASALPAALAARGHQVSTIMPMYRSVLDRLEEFTPVEKYLTITVGFRQLHGEVYKHIDKGVTTYFIRRDEYYDRTELYSTSLREYDDNADRFIFYQKAVVELIDYLKINPDVVHCNDWQTGLLPLYLRHGTKGQGRLHRAGTVFTIHNLAYQGVYSASEFPTTSLPFSCFTMSVMEYYGNMSFLKAGLTSSDRITTVSKTYAKEIQTQELGFGLDGVLRERTDSLTGIVNGVDYTLWDPEKDTHLPATYSAQDLSGKTVCRSELRDKFGLSDTKKTPLMGMIVRLVDQKGMDILEKAMPELMKRNLQFVLLGSGQKKYEDLLIAWNKEYEGRFHGIVGFNPLLAHKIEAASDLYCMPSRFEPCGLNQLYSLKYGAIPVVYATGGLEDTVDQIDEKGGTGTGYKFNKYTPEDFLAAIDLSLKHYKTPATWKKIIQRGMKKDFSWDVAAAQYEDVYADVIKS